MRVNIDKEMILNVGSTDLNADKAQIKENAENISKNTESIVNLSKKINEISTQTTTTVKGKAVILDTDFGGDIDDVTALATLLWAERTGLVDIIGISSSQPRAGEKNGKKYDVIGAMDAVCNYYGVSDMSFGLEKTQAENISNYCKSACEYQHTLTNSDAMDSPEFYRKALTSLPEGEKCDVAIIGYLTAFSRFLDSKADSISSVSGIELANAKINKLWIMGGGYPNGYVETNLANGGTAKMVNATANIIENFSNEIIWLGGEQSDVRCGDILIDNNLTWSIIYKCMNEFMQAYYDAHSSEYASLKDVWKDRDFAWDTLVVLAMCEDNGALTGFNYIKGTNSINTMTGSPDYGKNTFVKNDSGKHFYCEKQLGRGKDWFSHRLDSIIAENAWVSRKIGRVRLPR